MIKEKKEFRNRLVRLVIPIAMQQLMLSLVNVSDAVMLGFLNQDSLSAVSLAGQIQFVYNLFVTAVTGGISILAAQYWGINDKKSVEKILGIGLKLMVLISIPFTLAALFIPELLMKLFASDPSLIAKGADYLQVVAISYLLLAVSQVYLCIMKNCGQAGKCSLISSVSVVLNIILNWIFIFGVGPVPAMTIKGAALATVISKVIELAWAMIVMAKKDNLKINLKLTLFNDKILKKDYMKYALPLLGNMLAWGIGFTMYTVIMGHLGSDAAAANSIVNIVKNLSICVCSGVATASAVLVGGELGKGNLEKAKRYGSRLSHVSLVCGIISGCIILCIIPFVGYFSTISETAQGYMRVMLVVSSYYVVGKAMNMTIISGIFPSGGDSKFGLKCDTITMWCVTVPIGLIAAFVLKLPVVVIYALINIDEIVKLPAVYIHYKKYKWLNNLTRKEEIVSA
ncbi:MAG: MATE family efflux transporter [Ruminococcus callidus]|nr:MATE family efflux transporter [Ruminococcus callidus]